MVSITIKPKKKKKKLTTCMCMRSISAYTHKHTTLENLSQLTCFSFVVSVFALKGFVVEDHPRFQPS